MNEQRVNTANVTTVVDLSKWKDEAAVAGMMIGAATVHNVPYVWAHKSMRFTFNEGLSAHREMRASLEREVGARTYR